MKNKKGFTLIELLAVIVILGLLMAIAIPSVTKYITESRKKTVVSTIGNYITAMVNEVNDLTYTFTEENTIYAVPVECIALERGGTNPFGAWHQANDAYWAYVLVQYDDETSSYRYGYTFKDSAGYGLYPTTQAKLNEGGKQIQTGLELSRPKSGKVTNITAVDNWNGFVVDSSTNLVVLAATSEGNVGNGKTTCTLQQKGDNYDQVQGETGAAGGTEEDKKVINNIYYSSNEAQYVLKDGKWEAKEWKGLSQLDGRYIWTDGKETYYSAYSGGDYVLKGDTWESKTFYGVDSKYGGFSTGHMWTDNINTYYSYLEEQFVLNGNTWEKKEWKGLDFEDEWDGDELYGQYIWTDGTNIYHSFYHHQFVLNGNTWEKKEWDGFTPENGDYIWTDGKEIYYSYWSQQYVLKNGKWEPKEWNGFKDFMGCEIWTDGINMYITSGGMSYVLKGDTWEYIEWDVPWIYDSADIWKN